MRKSTIHIVLPFLLIANLMFGQVALNYLHTPHSLHTPGVKINDTKPNVHRHGEHCRVCSLDIVIHLLSESKAAEPELRQHSVQVIHATPAAELLRCSSIRDRAPPALI